MINTRLIKDSDVERRWGRCLYYGAILVMVAMAVIFFFERSAYADDSSIKGRQIATFGTPSGIPACASCHASQGEGNPAVGYPRLSGLPKSYITDQLQAFSSGTRSNPMMTPIAKLLSASDILDLASFYSALPSSVGTADTAPSPDKHDTTGENIALHGKWSENLPACVQCHGANGVGVGNVFPALAGQSSVYIQNQLAAWRSGTRAPGPLSLMMIISKKLTPAESKAVADYFASQAPVVRGNP